MVWCDGHRSTEFRAGMEIEVVGTAPAAAGPALGAPFIDRLVNKFALPVEGWRGVRRTKRTPLEPVEPIRVPAHADELRITDLGVIAEAVLEPGPG